MDKGGCQCTQVKYSLIGNPIKTYACHCTDCQTGSGSAFSMTMLIEKNKVRIDSGKTVDDEFHLNGNDLIRVRCAQCSSGLWYYSKQIPEILALKPGTLDDTKNIEPAAHVWTISKQKWVILDKNTPQFQQQPTIEELLAL